MIQSVFFDIDGTLVDSNNAHARAWVDAFAEVGKDVGFDRLRPLIGMGTDKLLSALATGIHADSDAGAALTNRRKAIFLERYVSGIVAFPGAYELVALVKSAQLRCVVASSASPDELGPLLATAGVSDLFDHAIGPDETGESKPDPDIISAALRWSETAPEDAVMIGDTSYDIEAAQRAGVRCIALRCGGSTGDALAAADAVFETPLDLAKALGHSDLLTLLTQSKAANV